jgi:hypothetical protein
MNIAIIGGGWVGCHLAVKLKNTHKITIYEKNKTLFEETSYNNQNRLHLGFHYSRNFKTRKLCLNTFDRFLKDYSFLTKELPKNLYCIPENESIIDYDTFKEIFNKYDIEEISTDLKNIEGCVKTNERFINFKHANSFFNNELRDLVINETIDTVKLKKLQTEYDLIINCTNNHIKDKNKLNSFYESTITLIYEKINETEFDALTLVDGKLFSIYPYQNNEYTVTDVEHTPIKKFKSVKKLNQFINQFNTDIVKKKQTLIESRIKKYYGNFTNDFKYKSYLLSTKSKIENLSDDRSPIISNEGNLVNCFTGKIQGIYLIEDYLKEKYNL